MVSTDNQQWQGFWHWLVADFKSPKHLQALSGCFFYRISSLQAGKNFLLLKIFSSRQNTGYAEIHLPEADFKTAAAGCWAGFLVLESGYGRL
ncbi:MAG: hypothetical protein ABH934_03750 [Chloroflexota bacterium]